MNRTVSKFVVGGCAGFVSYFFGGWDILLQVLVTLIVLDYISGVLAGYTAKELSSRVGYLGIIKKVSILIVVVVAVMLDRLLGSDVIRLAVCSFFIGNEGISLLENAADCGVPIPKKLLIALKQVRGEDEEQ